MKVKRETVKWAVRFMAVVVVVAVADALVGMFLSRPFPWIVILPASIPLLVVAFVIVPMKRAEKENF
jgi:hypothetical protein